MKQSSADIFQVEGAFESAVVYYLATSASFATHFLPAIKSELFESPHAELAVSLFVKYFKRKSKPPGSIAGAENLVVQWHNKGKITKKVKNACVDYLLDAALTTSIEEEDVHDQFADLVRSWKHYNTTMEAFDLAMQRKPITEIIDRIVSADSILHKKETTHSFGTLQATQPWLDVIKKSGMRDRHPTGIVDWDIKLEGGPARKTLSTIVSPTGGGKSKLLRQLAASAVIRGTDVAYISLEDDDSTAVADIFSAISGVPLKYTIMNPDGIEPYVLRNCRRLRTQPGTLFVEEFPAGITVTECLVALDKKFGELKVRPQMYVFDYLDRFGGGTKIQDSEYASGGDVTQCIRNYVRKWNAWGWTACQSKRLASKDSYKQTDENSVAGSMHKARITDVLVNLQHTKDADEDRVRAWFSKNRGGKANRGTDWVTPMFGYGHVFESPDFDPIPLDKLRKDPMFRDLIEDIA